MSKATRKSTRTWMLGLIGRQGVSGSVDDIEAQIALSLPAFIARFPSEAFCAASLDAVAGAEKFWNEARVMAALEAWQRSNEPAGPALPAQAAAAPVSEQAKHWLAGFYRAGDDRQAARALDLMRAQSPEAYEYVCRADLRAADIAVARRWPIPRTARDMADEWDDEAGIRRIARRLALETSGDAYGTNRFNFREFLMATLARTVKIHAPQHGWAMLDEWDQIAHPPVTIDAVVVPSPLFGDD